jgi:hypothetical protein
MDEGFEWTIEQESLLRSCTFDNTQRSMLTRLLELDHTEKSPPFEAENCVRSASIKGQPKGHKPLSVAALEFLVNTHTLNTQPNKMSLSHQWFEGTPWNFDFLDPDKSMVGQLDKLTQRIELIYGCKEDDYRLNEIVDRIAPLKLDHAKTSRFTILLPNQPSGSNIESTRNDLVWDSHVIVLNHDSDKHLINRIIVLFQLLGLYNTNPSKGSTLNDFMELISKRGKDNYWEYREGRCVYALGHDLMDQLDTYEKDDLPEAPYFNFKLKKPMNFSVIRSDKSSKHDSKATDNDLRDIRTALTNLITHTGGIAITFDVANINGDQSLSLATPSIAVPESQYSGEG